MKDFADSILGKIEEETSENQVRVLGNVIGGVSDKGYRGLIGASLLTERDVAALSNDVNWQGFTADGEARLLVQIQSTSPKTVSLSLTPKNSDQELHILLSETLDRNPVPSTFTLEDVGGGKYQKTIVLRAPESWPTRESWPNPSKIGRAPWRERG